MIGPSGSGKSTLAKLILGFYRPSSGRILLGGRDIRHFLANELRSRIGVVPQETRLFSGSVYENLQMANPLASFEEIISACQWAGIHDVIDQLPILFIAHKVPKMLISDETLIVVRVALQRYLN